MYYNAKSTIILALTCCQCSSGDTCPLKYPVSRTICNSRNILILGAQSMMIVTMMWTNFLAGILKNQLPFAMFKHTLTWLYVSFYMRYNFCTNILLHCYIVILSIVMYFMTNNFDGLIFLHSLHTFIWVEGLFWIWYKLSNNLHIDAAYTKPSHSLKRNVYLFTMYSKHLCAIINIGHGGESIENMTTFRNHIWDLP